MYLKSLFITVVVCSATMANAQTCDITEDSIKMPLKKYVLLAQVIRITLQSITYYFAKYYRILFLMGYLFFYSISHSQFHIS